MMHEENIPSDALHYAGALFHPNNNMFALLTCDNALKYYCSEKVFKQPSLESSLEKSACIAQYTVNLDATNKIKTFGKRLSFSPAGNNILAALQNKCLIIPVPLKILYTPETIKKIIFISWLLQNNLDFYIPQDVIRIIIKKVFKCFV
jgi:hypothetical protein